MNTYYYGYRAQKEAIEEIGEVVTLPIKKIIGFNYASDSTKMAIIGVDNEKQRDMSLYVFNRDTLAEKEIRNNRLESKKNEKEDKSKFLNYLAMTFGIQSRLRKEALAKMEEVMAKEHELLSLGGQAAAAAHSLGTPLSTIKLITQELSKQLKGNKEIEIVHSFWLISLIFVCLGLVLRSNI